MGSFGGIYWITLIQFIFVPKRISFVNMAKVCLLLGLMLVSAVFAKHDEWYCKVDSDKYQICRKCKTLEEDCDYEAPEECKCENMKFANTEYELVGGPETCQTEDPFCYVSENSNCEDREYSSVNDRLNRIWLNTEIYYSYEACDARSQDDDVGNEEFLDSTKIVGDRVQEVSDNGILGDDLFFWLDEDFECQAECKSRPGLCGAWSFDNTEGKCYLHTVDGCCGQFGKQEANSDWISGYVCPHCWSTKGNTDCPCTIKDRAVIPKTAHGAGGKSPLHATSSGSVTVQSVPGGEDKCKCIPKRTKRGRFRCIKPTCARFTTETVNGKDIQVCPDGCCDKRKCRTAKKGGRRPNGSRKRNRNRNSGSNRGRRSFFGYY